MAYDKNIDSDLIGYSTKGLLPRCTTWIAFNKNLLIRKYMLTFVELFAPHLDRDIMTQYLTNNKVSENENKDVDSNVNKESRLPMHEMWHI
jgi:LysR family cys regulon transcriptional activator